MATIFGKGLETWSMFQCEADIGLQLDHPNIVRFLRLPTLKQRRYLVMEYVSGTTLASRLLAQGSLREREALPIVRQLAAALVHMHERGFVHYDLKPENIMLQSDGTIRLIDLGLAHALVGRFSLVGSMPRLGSSGYIAPEQIKQQRGRRSADIYGVGAILYRLLTGRHPFPDEDEPFVAGSARFVGDPDAPRRLNPNISPEVEEIVLRAQRRDPKQRWQVLLIVATAHGIKITDSAFRPLVYVSTQGLSWVGCFTCQKPTFLLRL